MPISLANLLPDALRSGWSFWQDSSASTDLFAEAKQHSFTLGRPHHYLKLYLHLVNVLMLSNQLPLILQVLVHVILNIITTLVQGDRPPSKY